MINTVLLTEEEICARSAGLSDPVAAVLDNPATEHIVEEICNERHVSEPERVLVVKQLTTLVLLGIIHDYDLGRELDQHVFSRQNSKVADDVASALSAKIFLPIKADLAKIYRPLISEDDAGGLPSTAPTAPAKLIDAIQGKPLSTEMPKIAPSSFGSKPFPSAPSTSAAAVRPVTPISSSSAPLSPTAPITPKPAIPVGAPAPVMLHQETQFQPIVQAQGTPGIKANTAQKPPGPGAVSMFSATKSLAPQGPGASGTVTAKLELGTAGEQVKATAGRTNYAPPRIVNYGSSSPSASPFGVSMPPPADGMRSKPAPTTHPSPFSGIGQSSTASPASYQQPTASPSAPSNPSIPAAYHPAPASPSMPSAPMQPAPSGGQIMPSAQTANSGQGQPLAARTPIAASGWRPVAPMQPPGSNVRVPSPPTGSQQPPANTSAYSPAPSGSTPPAQNGNGLRSMPDIKPPQQ